MSVKSDDFHGDVNIVRNLDMGGSLDVMGNAVVRHNLKVQGFLDAPNIKDTNKGIFRNADDLPANPTKGWFALVETSTPGSYSLYIVGSGGWEPSATITLQVSISYVEDLINSKLDKSTLAQGVGTSVDNAMSQNATTDALDKKVDKILKINGKSLDNDVNLVKDDIGLGNVDNTSDEDKPVSIKQQDALDEKVDKRELNKNIEGTLRHDVNAIADVVVQMQDYVVTDASKGADGHVNLTKLQEITEDDYKALTTKRNDTLYLITE